MVASYFLNAACCIWHQVTAVDFFTQEPGSSHILIGIWTTMFRMHHFSYLHFSPKHQNWHCVLNKATKTTHRYSVIWTTFPNIFSRKCCFGLSHVSLLYKHRFIYILIRLLPACILCRVWVEHWYQYPSHLQVSVSVHPETTQKLKSDFHPKVDCYDSVFKIPSLSPIFSPCCFFCFNWMLLGLSYFY